MGRKEESAILGSLCKSPKSEFLAVYGRRRVGKTFLLRKKYIKSILVQKKQIFIAITSANGIKPTMYSEEIVSGIVTKDDLFSNY